MCLQKKPRSQVLWSLKDNFLVVLLSNLPKAGGLYKIALHFSLHFDCFQSPDWLFTQIVRGNDVFCFNSKSRLLSVHSQ